MTHKNWKSFIKFDHKIKKKYPLGVVVISAVMFFVAFAIDIFWLGKLFGKAPHPTIPIDLNIFNAFAVPDIFLSLILYIGAYGLLKLKKYGFVISLIAMGMWLFDLLLVLAITKSSRLNFIFPSLFFILSSLIYLWVKKELFD